jgi:hypothetical protein
VSDIKSLSRRQMPLPPPVVRKPSPTALASGIGSTREDNLQRQLAEQLSSEIARIRRQIGGGNQPDLNSADGNGRILNITA